MTADPATADRAEAVLEARDLHRAYGPGDGATVALEGASLAVRPGELVAIRGRSGSGKTTLLNLVSGLDEADEGRVRVLGEALGELSTDERLALRAEHVGFVFQEAALVPELKLWENVAVSARIAGRTHDEARQAALDALAVVDLDGLADRYPGEISGGEAQRASVARALAKQPAILLADEPTANLDHDTAQTVADRIRDHVREAQAAALVVTHDDIMADRADRVERLRNGRLTDG
jgi:putative ABC transport system ATP-binding protein